MGLTVSKSIYLEIAHRLVGHPIPANDRVHGHSLKVTITAARDGAVMDGMVLDFAVFDSQVAVITSLLDHRYLNDIDGLPYPTLESVAQFIGIRMALVAPLRTVKVLVERTSLGQAAEWTPDLAS